MAEEGDGTVDVCVDLMALVSVERDVEVTVETRNGTALGEWGGREGGMGQHWVSGEGGREGGMGQHWVSGEGGRNGTALGEWGEREGGRNGTALGEWGGREEWDSTG